MPESFSVGTIWHAPEYGFGTWQITAIDANHVQYIAENQVCKSFHGGFFYLDKKDFEERWKSGTYKKGENRTSWSRCSVWV